MSGRSTSPAASSWGLLRTKSIADLRAEAEAGELRRALGPLDLTAIGVGAIVGAGIFVLTGQAAARYAGPAIVLSFLLAGAACALAGLCYAEMASMIPVSGSAYTYAYATMGELVAWIIGWDLVLEYSFSAASVAVGWSGYFASFLRDAGVYLPPEWANPRGVLVTLADGSRAASIFNVPAALAVLLMSGLLLLGIRESARVNTVMVVIKLGVIVLFVAIGAAFIDVKNWTPFIPENTGTFGQFGWSGVVRGAAVIFVAYLGFDAVSTVAQEARAPQRDLPVGMMASLGLCFVLYVAVAVVLTGIVPFSRLDVADPIAVGTDMMGVMWLRPVIKLGALTALSSVLLVLLLGQPRILFSMSRDGLLPAAFRRVHSRWRTPYFSTALTGGLVAIAAGLFPVATLSELVSIGTLFALALVCVGVLVLRRTQPALDRPFRVPGSPWIPLAGAAVCVYLMTGLPIATWLRLVIWLAIGLGIYFLYGRASARQTRTSSKAYAGS
jgi:APA family basic amino acid/polyamine antiporter